MPEATGLFRPRTESSSARIKGPAQATLNGIPPYYPHQEKSLELLARESRVFDTSDPGTAKTRVALGAWLARDSGALLVLAPRSLLTAAWGADLKRFFPEVRYSIARAENREEAFKAKADVYITNTDAAKWLAKQPKTFFKRFDTVVVDEMADFKHRTSQRSKALAKIRGYFDYREGLTGTPNSLSVTDLWHQLYILDDGQRLGKKFFQFRGAVCQPEQVGPSPNHVRWVDKPYAEEAVAQMIADITIRHEFAEVMKDVPGNHSQPVSYELTPKHMRAYKELEKNAILRFEEETVSAVNAAVLREKLLQVASGAVYHTEGEWTLLDTGRYELILDLVEARKHSIVFFNWSHQKVELIKEASKRGIKHELIDGTTPDRRRDEIVEAYQAGFYQTLFLHPKTGAHGLTLTKGTATIWASPTYRADFLKQGMHRVYRAGQTEHTETLLVEAAGTVEKKVYQRLNEKTERMVNLLSILKENTECT